MPRGGRKPVCRHKGVRKEREQTAKCFLPTLLPPSPPRTPHQPPAHRPNVQGPGTGRGAETHLPAHGTPAPTAGWSPPAQPGSPDAGVWAESRPLPSKGRDGGGGGRLGARQGPHPAAHGHKHVRALRRTLLTYINIRVTAPSGPASPNGELTQGTWANLGHSLSRPRLFPGRFLLRSCFRPRAFRPGPADGVGAPEGARPPSLRVVKLGQPCRLSGTQPLAPR